MNLTIARSVLAEVTAQAASVADGKTHPLCGFTRLRAVGKALVVTATDLNVTSISTLPAAVKDAGAICVEAKRLAQVIAALPTGDVTLGLDGPFLTVKCGKSTSRINGQRADDYPKTPNPAESTFAACSPANLAAMIGRALPCVALDESRGAFCGVLFEMGATSARMVATDGNRLVRTDCDLGLPARASVIIPARGAKAIREALKDADGAEVAFEGNVIMVRVGSTTVAAKLMDMTYQPYGQVVDHAQKNKSRTVVNRAELIAALARAVVMVEKDSKESTHGIRLTIGDGSMSIHATHPDHGDTLDEVDATTSGKPAVIGVHPRFLRTALLALDGDEVVIMTNGALDAFTVTPVDGDATLTVIMPMRLP